MKTRHGRVVTALAELIVHDYAGPSELPVEPVTRFVLETQARMPDYLRIPLRVLTVSFDMCSLLVSGKPFHRLPLAVRREHLQGWTRSRLAFRRDLIKFYVTLCVFGLYSEKYTQDYVFHPSYPIQDHG